MRHFLLVALYSFGVATFFAALLRDDLRSALRLFAVIFGIMVGGVFAAGWLMLLLGG